jgi:hypothetical protein
MSNVTLSTFGNHRGPREPGDLERYPTPPIAVTGLLGVETIAPRVINPCGTDDDAITTVLRAAGHTVSTNDVAAGGVDLMTVTTLPADCIVMNAPFTRSADFVLHALEIGAQKVCVCSGSVGLKQVASARQQSGAASYSGCSGSNASGYLPTDFRACTAPTGAERSRRQR